MEKFLRMFLAIFVGVLPFVTISCGDDDDPSDPSMPESGTWTITDYENLAIRLNSGTVSGDSYWINEFKKEINNRKIRISQSTPLEDGWYILSRDDKHDNIGYLNDLEKIEVIEVNGKTMIANYYLKQYLSTMSDDHYVIFRAEVTLNKK